MSKLKPLISIIIVNWNGKENLLSCLSSLQKCRYKNIEYIVVDNGSTDDSIKMLKKLRLKNLIIVKNRKNLGYAEGNNIGVKHASGDLLLLLNNDTLVDRNFIEPLVKEIISNPKIGAVQPKILNYPQKNYIDSIGSYFISSGFLYHYGHNKLDQKKYTKPSDILSMKGACMLFKKEVIDKIGLFETNYFAYFEETDLCMRAYLAGYRIRYVPKSFIYHKGGNTAGKLPASFIQYHAYKNRIYTYMKNMEIGTLLKVMPIHILLYLAVTGAFFLRGQFSLGFAVLRSIWWNIINLPLIIKKRKHLNSNIRRIRDGDYLNALTRQVRPSYYIHLFTTSLAGYID